jgi:hypothetical protein
MTRHPAPSSRILLLDRLAIVVIEDGLDVHLKDRTGLIAATVDSRRDARDAWLSSETETNLGVDQALTSAC